jgi:type VII secretion protein EccE
VVGAFAVAAAGAPLAAAAAVAAVGVLVAAVRLRGRWGLDWVRVWLRHRTRRSRPRAAWARVRAVTGHLDRSGATFGVMTGDAVLGMVVAVHPAAGVPPMELLTASLDDRGVRLDAVQLVVRRGGRAGPDIRIALQLRPGDCPGAVLARGGGAEGARRALSAVTTRLTGRLGDHRYRTRVLDPAELNGLLADAYPGKLVEHWDHCVIDGSRQVGYAITRWPADLAGFLDALGRMPTARTIAAVVATAGDRGPRLRGVVRVVEPPAPAPDGTERGALAAVLSVAELYGAQLVRLDGEHGPAVATTIPGAV